jgi:predicted metal-dependent phosphoesterase TrpH
MTKDQEAELLSEQAKDFTEALEEIKKRLEELSAKEK